MQRKLLLWTRKPIERQLSEIAEVRPSSNVDPASGAQIWNTMLVMRSRGLMWFSAGIALIVVSVVLFFLG